MSDDEYIRDDLVYQARPSLTLARRLRGGCLRMLFINHKFGRHLLSLLELVNSQTAFVKVLCCFPLSCPAQLCLMMHELGVIVTIC